MVNTTVALVISGVGALCFISLYRAVVGPTAADRVVAVGAVTSKTTVIILLLAFFMRNSLFLDVALTFVLCSFIATICVVRFLYESKTAWRDKDA
jgi:multicomponent Na+:H+ antiporter subunit F